MRRLSTPILLALVACGHGDGRPRDAAPGEPPGDVAVDALPPRCTPRAGTQLVARPVAHLDYAAVLVASPPYDPRLFVVDQSGSIRVIDNDVLLPAPFLTITRATTNLDAGGEQGLLGLAFHPKFASNGTFYIFYTTSEPSPPAFFNVLARYRVSAADHNVADATSGEILLKIPHDARNHNAGMIEFGSDGLLYISTGDGAGQGFVNSQNPHQLLGKMLRIDVDGGTATRPYGIPAGNPFTDGAAGAAEVFMLGFRNPWRWSFDRANGDIYLADVGQDAVEELDIIPAGQGAGKNFGWYPFEGATCAAATCDATAKTFPVMTKDHLNDKWCAIVGGQVYRGPCMPDLVGTYLMTDYCAGGLWGITASNGELTSGPTRLPGTFPADISSIHADERGELFLTTTSGDVFQLELAP